MALTLVHLETSDGQQLSIRKLEGREAISRLYEFEVDVVEVEGASLDADSLVGKRIDLVWMEDDAEKRRVRAVAASVQEILDSETDVAVVRIRLVPTLFRASLNVTSTVYVDMTIPEIIEAKLLDLGLQKDTEFELRLQQTYPKREYVVQYKESDVAFVSRWCEHLGISFFFEERDDSEAIVFVDRTGAFDEKDAPPVVAYHRRGEPNGVFAFTSSTRVIPNHYMVRDYNYRMPSVDLTGDVTLPVGEPFDVVEYGTHHKTPAEAAYIAQVRSEEQLASRKVYEGKSDSLVVRPGAFFTVEGHPRGDLTLLVTEVEHHATQAIGGGDVGEHRRYSNEFRGIPKGTPFRPARLTPKPRVPGVITGVIDAGSSGTYAELDDQGRYQVRFVFDQSDNESGKSSHPVRMAQPHAGAGYGMHFPLRPGVEVVLTCVEGDPDRPIIAGTVPNPTTPSPVTAGNNARNIVRTGAGNEMNMDDSQGSERIKISTPHSSTRLQLGAPNDPEAGAILATHGAWTQFSGSGISGLTSIKTEITNFAKLARSQNISTVAEAMGKAEKTLLALEMITGATEMASQALELIEGFKKANNNRALVQVQKQKEAQKENAKYAELGRTDADMSKVSACTVTPAMDPTKLAALKQAQADYAAARQAYQTTLQTGLDFAAGDRDALFNLERLNDADTTVKGDEDAVVTAWNALSASGGTPKTKDGAVYQQALVVKGDLAGIQAASYPIDGVDDQPDSPDKLVALKKAIKDLEDDDHLKKCDKCKKALDDMKDKATEFAPSFDANGKPKGELKKMMDAQLEASNAKKEFDDYDYEETYSKDAWDRKQAAQYLSDIQTGEGAATLLMSTIFSLYNFVKRGKELLDLNLQWKDFQTTTNATGARATEEQNFMMDVLKSRYHRIGAENSMIVTSEKKFFSVAPRIAFFAGKMEGENKALYAGLDAAATTAIAGVKLQRKALGNVRKQRTEKTVDHATATPALRDAKKALAVTAQTAVTPAVEAADAAVEVASDATAMAIQGLITMTAERALHLGAKEHAELSAGEQLWLSSEYIDIQGADGMELVAADGEITLDAAKENISLFAAKGQIGGHAKEIGFTAEKAGIVSDHLALDGKDDATLTGKKIILDAGPSGSIALICGNFILQISSKGISMSHTMPQPSPGMVPPADAAGPLFSLKSNGVTIAGGPMSSVVLKAAEANLNGSSSSIKVAAAGITQTGPQLKNG